MSKLKSLEELFGGRHCDWEIIVLCVRSYLRYKLSLRDLVEMMAERGLSLAHTTILHTCCSARETATMPNVVSPSQRYLKFERGAAAVSAASLRR